MRGVSASPPWDHAAFGVQVDELDIASDSSILQQSKDQQPNTKNVNFEDKSNSCKLPGNNFASKHGETKTRSVLLVQQFPATFLIQLKMQLTIFVKKFAQRNRFISKYIQDTTELSIFYAKPEGIKYYIDVGR